MTEPYWADDQVALYLGDCREVLPALGLKADLVVADPPYAETSLAWDRWPDGWVDVAAGVTDSLWCFGSMRMFLERRDEFAGWKLSQDIIWEKHNGPGFQADRFRRVHELALHWYSGPWGDQHRNVPREQTSERPKVIARRATAPHQYGERHASVDVRDGTILMRSVLQVRSMHGHAIHPTQKPSGIIQPLLEYACPPGGLVVDPFAGSGSTLITARACGRRAIGVETNEAYCEAAARWLSQLTLEFS